MKKLSQREKNFRISQGLKAAWKRRGLHRPEPRIFNESPTNGDTLHAAVDFVKAVGGLDKAKATIDLIEEIGKAL